MRFKYSMDSVLKYKEQKEEMEKVKLADLNQKRKQTIEKAKKIENHLSHFKNNIMSNKVQNVKEMVLHNNYFNKLENELVEQNEEIEEQSKACDNQRDILVASQRERKIFDMHKTKEKMAFNKELQKKEEKDINEMAIMRFNRQK